MLSGRPQAAQIVCDRFRIIARTRLFRGTRLPGGNICIQMNFGKPANNRSAYQPRSRRAARSSRERRRGIASPATLPSLSILRGGKVTAAASLGNGSTLFGSAMALMKMLLEMRLQRRLDLLDALHRLLDLAAMVAVEQRHQRAGAGGIADGLDLGEVAVGDEPQHHRVFRVDEGAEGAGEADRVDLARRPAFPSAA